MMVSDQVNYQYPLPQDEVMVKLSVRVSPVVAQEVENLPGTTSDVLREAIGIGLRKMERRRKKRKRK